MISAESVEAPKQPMSESTRATLDKFIGRPLRGAFYAAMYSLPFIAAVDGVWTFENTGSLGRSIASGSLVVLIDGIFIFTEYYCRRIQK